MTVTVTGKGNRNVGECECEWEWDWNCAACGRKSKVKHTQRQRQREGHSSAPPADQLCCLPLVEDNCSVCNCDLASPRGHGAAPMEAIRNRKKADDNNLRAEQSAPAVGHSCSRLPSSLSSLYSHCFFASHLSPHPSSISPPSLPHTCFRGLTVWHDHFVDFAFALDIGSGCGSLCSPLSCP